MALRVAYSRAHIFSMTADQSDLSGESRVTTDPPPASRSDPLS